MTTATIAVSCAVTAAALVNRVLDLRDTKKQGDEGVGDVVDGQGFVRIVLCEEFLI